MLHDEPALQQILALTARVMAIRDIVARLLADEARRSGDPVALLERYSKGTDDKIAVAEKLSPDDVEMMEASESIRAEMDSILVEARAILRRG